MPKNNYSNSLLSVGACLIGSLLFGLSLGFSGPAIDTMKDNVLLHGQVLHINRGSDLFIFDSPSSAYTFSSILNLGFVGGALIAGVLLDYVGRRRTLVLSSLFFMGTWLWMALLNTATQALIVRVLNGAVCGVGSVAVPTYIGEVSPTSIRGILGALNHLAITIGIMLAYLWGVVFRTNADTAGAPADFFCNWRFICFINIIPSALLGLCMLPTPESPRWFALRRQGDNARESLKRLRGGNPTFEEVQEIDVMIEYFSSHSIHQRVRLTDLWQSKYQLFVGIMIQAFQQLSGIQVAYFYQTSIFQAAHVSNATSNAFGVMVAEVLSSAFGAALMDKAGRKVLFTSSALGMAVASFCLGGFFVHTSPGWLGLVAMYAFLITFSYGVGVIPWLIMPEIFPHKVRGVGSSMAIVANGLCAFIVTKFLPNFVHSGVFFFFGGICVIMAIFMTCLCPETKGKSFEEIQTFFENRALKGKNIQSDVSGV